MKTIILCADDYGQNQATSQGIIHLFQLNRLSATSCLTTTPHWLTHAAWLEPYKNQFDIGLHFNLTEGKSLTPAFQQGFPSLGTLLIKSQCRQLDPAAIAAELNAQLDQFMAAMGCAPHFIDGHQHIHHFPIIRDVILVTYQKRLRHTQAYIRSVAAPIKFKQFKKTIIQLSGAKQFQKQLIAHHIPHNTSFSGIYDFSASKQYAAIFPTFLREVTHQGLIMCHPGLAGNSTDDGIAASRPDEYQYFLSDQFLKDCENADVILRKK